ncbi:MAG: hypothetical protein EBS59_03040 [Verrucomicrobia bacterium]|nr:hypothetical protein [Verrucomicrobiota bacterium]
MCHKSKQISLHFPCPLGFGWGTEKHKDLQNLFLPALLAPASVGFLFYPSFLLLFFYLQLLKL